MTLSSGSGSGSSSRTWDGSGRAGRSASVGRARVAFALEHGTQVLNLTHGCLLAEGSLFRRVGVGRVRAGKGSAGATSRSLKGSYSSAGERRSEGIDVISLGMGWDGWDEVLSGYERQTIRRRSHRHRTVHHLTHGTGWMGSSGGLVSGLRGLADRQGVPLGAGLARYSCMRFRVHAVPASRCIRPVPRGAWIREVRWRWKARDCRRVVLVMLRWAVAE